MVNSTGRVLVGEVVSTKNAQTVVVRVEHEHRHPLYKKAVRTTKKYVAHCEVSGIQVGDYVQISETKPISKTKYFKVLGKIAK